MLQSFFGKVIFISVSCQGQIQDGYCFSRDQRWLWAISGPPCLDLFGIYSHWLISTPSLYCIKQLTRPMTIQGILCLKTTQTGEKMSQDGIWVNLILQTELIKFDQMMKDYLSPVMIRTVCSCESDVWSWWRSVYTDWGCWVVFSPICVL